MLLKYQTYCIARIILVAFIYIFNAPLFSQNLVPNGNFELFKNDFPEKWELLSGSPDAFNLSNLKSNIHWQTNKSYFRNIKSKGFVGIAFSSSFTEALGIQLETPLIPSTEYQISVRVLTSNSCKVGLEKITVGISNSKIEYSEQPKNFMLNAVELTNEKRMLEGMSWHIVKNTFIATGKEKYIYLGNFNKQNATYIKSAKEIFLNNETLNSCNYIIFDFIELKTDLPKDNLPNENLIVLEDVTFESGQAIIKKEALKKLDAIFLRIQATDSSINITGHTDNVGNERDNKLLSFERANAIKQFLLDKGIALNRIHAEGVGESQPNTTNDTVEGRQKNRRVEITILN